MSVATSTALAIGGIAAGVGGGLIAKKGADNQAKAAENAASQANNTELQMYNQNRQDLAPWRSAGGNAVTSLAGLVMPHGAGGPGGSGSQGTPGGSLWNNFSTNDFQTDPGYQFRLSEGAKALERSAASKGSLFSGGTLKDLSNYNQNFASNEFQNAYNRFQTNRNTQFNQLASIAGLGQTAAGTTANLGAQTANGVANNTISGLTGAAAARASGYNAIGNGINQGLGGLQNWYLLSQLNGGGGMRSVPTASPDFYTTNGL